MRLESVKLSYSRGCENETTKLLKFDIFRVSVCLKRKNFAVNGNAAFELITRRYIRIRIDATIYNHARARGFMLF